MSLDILNPPHTHPASPNPPSPLPPQTLALRNVQRGYSTHYAAAANGCTCSNLKLKKHEHTRRGHPLEERISREIFSPTL